MSFGCRILVWGLVLFGMVCLTNAAAIQNPGNVQLGMQKNNSDFQRNASPPGPLDSRFSMSSDQTHRPDMQGPTSQPFGIHPAIPPISLPPLGARPMLAVMPPPGMAFFSPPNMNGLQQPQQQQQPPQQQQQPPQQQQQPQLQQPRPSQSQLPKREEPMANKTSNPLPMINSNMTRGNNNTRRDAEQTTVNTTTKSSTTSQTTHKPSRESPQGNDQKESEGSRTKQQQTSATGPMQFLVPPQSIIPSPSNPIFLFDSMGQRFMLVPAPMQQMPIQQTPFQQFPMQHFPMQQMPVGLSFGSSPFVLREGPQGPPIQSALFQPRPAVPLAQPLPGNAPVTTDFGKQNTPNLNDKNKNTTTSH